MSNEILVNIEADWEVVNKIFSNPKISKSFENGFKKNKKTLRVYIIQYRRELKKSKEIEHLKDLIPLNDDLIISEFKELLKGQIIVSAMSKVITEASLDVEKNIIELTDPDNMIELYSNIIPAVFVEMIQDSLMESTNSQFMS